MITIILLNVLNYVSFGKRKEKNARGIELLKKINLEGFISAKDSDYESVRKQKLLPVEPLTKIFDSNVRSK